MPFRITQRHSDSAVRDSAYAINFDIILLPHHASTFVAHHFRALSFVNAVGESVIDAEE